MHTCKQSNEQAVADAKKAIQAAQNRQKLYADKKRTPVSYEIGQEVLLSTKNLNITNMGTRKLVPRFIGPYPVTDVINEVAIKLALPDHLRIHDVFHVGLLRRHNKDSRSQPPPPTVTVEGQEEYVVDTVLQHEVRKCGKGRTKTYYLIKWQGYGPEYNTWEPEDNLTSDGKFENSKLTEYWANLTSLADQHLSHHRPMIGRKRTSNTVINSPSTRANKKR